MGLLGDVWILGMVAMLAAAAGAAVLCACGPIDTPNGRSNHSRPRPRAGGLSLILGAGAALLALLAGAAPQMQAAIGADAARVGLILAACGLGGLVGLLDDLSLLGLRTKFGGVGAAAVLGALAAGPVTAFGLDGFSLQLPFLLGLAGAALWVFVIINAVNFMDGADGMLAAGMGVSGAALALFGAAHGAPVAVVCGVLLAGSLLGFLPFNAPRSRMFAGDCGALFAGMLFACGAIDLAANGAHGVLWVTPLLIAPFLADVFSTLIARVRSRANLAEAHREHLYQLLVARGAPHWAVALLYALAGAVCAGVAALAYRGGATAALAALALMAALGLGLALWLRAKARMPGVRTRG